MPMRGRTLRAGARALGLASTRRESLTDRLAELTRQITAETGAFAPIMLRLIERRAPNVTPAEAAHFILERWRADGEDRQRLIEHASKDDRTLAAERALAFAVQRVAKPFAGQPFSVARENDVRAALMRYVRDEQKAGRIPPTVPIEELRAVVRTAVEYTAERLSIRIDGLAKLFVTAPPEPAQH